jgi:hypothetical protein
MRVIIYAYDGLRRSATTTPQAALGDLALEEHAGAKVLPHIADVLGKLGDTIARHIPEIDRFADAVGQTIGRAIDAAVPLVKGFASGCSAWPACSHRSSSTSSTPPATCSSSAAGSNAHSRREGVGKALGIVCQPSSPCASDGDIMDRFCVWYDVPVGFAWGRSASCSPPIPLSRAGP